MASSVRSQSEELRLKNYQLQLRQAQDLEIRELENRHKENVTQLIANQTQQLEQLKRAYDVQISREAETLDEKLQATRLQKEQTIAEVKNETVEEVEKIQTAHKKRIEDYKKQGESQIESLRNQLQASAEALHERSKRMNRKSSG